MYSAVLMLALTAGNEAVDFGKHRCHEAACCAPVSYGCTGYVGCTSYVGCSTYASCSSSCHAKHGLFARRHSCSCTPVCSGAVIYGCSTTYGCTSGVPVMPPPVMKKEMPKGVPAEKLDAPKSKTSLNVPATIIVSLPADARLIVDGSATTSTSDRRVLMTPVLENGSTYVYTMQAEVTREGRTMTQTQQVTVRGGETSNVQFSFGTQSVASR